MYEETKGNMKKTLRRRERKLTSMLGEAQTKQLRWMKEKQETGREIRRDRETKHETR